MEMMLPITDNEYYSLTMSRLSDVKPGNEYKIKKGDSLWSIASEQLSNKVKSGEISSYNKADILNYTYKLAKLNNFNSLDKMNNLKVNDKLVLPQSYEDSSLQTTSENNPTSDKKADSAQNVPAKVKLNKVAQQTESKKVQTVVTSKAQTETSEKSSTFSTLSLNEPIESNNAKFTNPWSSESQYQSTWSLMTKEIKIPFAPEGQIKSDKKDQASKPKEATSAKSVSKSVAKPVQKLATSKPKEAPKTNAQLGFADVRDEILNADTNLFYARCTQGLSSDVYALYKYNEAYTYRKTVAMFTLDKQGNLVNIKFDGRKDELSSFDFTVDRNGTVSQKTDIFGNNTKVVDKVDSKDCLKLEQALRKIVETSKRLK